jgi:hypothetical protein
VALFKDAIPVLLHPAMTNNMHNMRKVRRRLRRMDILFLPTKIDTVVSFLYRAL